MTAIEHSMLNGEMVTGTVDFYPDTTKPVRAVLDCTTARRQYCPQTSVSDNVVYVSDNGSIAAGVYTLTITCTDTQGKKRRYKSDPCIEVYDATGAAEIAATFDSQTYELNGVFYTFAGGGGTVQADWDETDPNAPSYIQNKPDLSEYATDEELQAVEESIPDVPAWALQPQKPTYTATEVGAVPTSRTVNGKALSQDITLNANDVGAYQKPSSGIPKSDFASGVQQSLNKADTALQQSDLTPIENDIDAIEAKIPSAASASNQLADKAFVNSVLAAKQDTLTFDNTPTANSNNPVTSEGIMAALDTKANQSDTYTKTEVDNKLADGVCTGNTVGTDIKQLKDKNNVVFYPQTHTKAVVDDNGYSVESRMQAVQDVVNQAQMAIGAVPSDLTPTEDSTNWVTSGGVYNAMQGVQSELDAMLKEDEHFYVGTIKVAKNKGYVISYSLPFVVGKTYKINLSCNDSGTGNIGAYLYQDPQNTDTNLIVLGKILGGENTAEITYKHESNTDYHYFGLWNNRSSAVTVTVEIYEQETISLHELYSSVFTIKDKLFFEKGAIVSGEDTAGNGKGIRTPYIPVEENLTISMSMGSGMPAAEYQYLVFYKDGDFVSSTNYGINSVVEVNTSSDYNQVRILLYRTKIVTEESANNSFVIVTPAAKIDNIKEIDKRVTSLENKGNASTVEIYNSDIAIDLSTEVLDLTDKTYTANSRFSGTSVVTVSGWKLLNDIIPITAGIYHVVDNTGSMILFQLAYVNSNGDILKSFDIYTGHFVSNHFLRTLGATGIKIAVKATSLSGLHLVNGRKFKIVDEAKRNTFNNLCSDGRINVAYMKDSSDVNRIVMALKLAGSYGVVFIPSGRYELSSCIYAGVSGQSIEMEPDTMLVASNGFTDNYLMEWEFSAVDESDPEFPNTYGESSALTNAHITGGVFNAKGLCGCLRVHNFRGLKVSNCQFYNASTKAVSVERPGYELIMHGCAARNDIPGLANNIGFNLLCNDCHYYDLITVNYNIGFKVTQNSFLTRCHPWIGRCDFPTYYPNSIGFDLSGSIGTQVTDCYSDTMQTHYKLGQQTKLVGCTALSYVSDIFPIDEYGNVNLIHNDYNNNVIIGCTFRTSNITPVRNSGSKEVTEIGCTYT